MRIGIRLFFMIGNITAWFSQAVTEGRISADECFELLMMILAGLGVKTDFDASKLKEAMLAMEEEERSPNPEDVLDIAGMLNRG